MLFLAVFGLLVFVVSGQEVNWVFGFTDAKTFGELSNALDVKDISGGNSQNYDDPYLVMSNSGVSTVIFSDGHTQQYKNVKSFHSCSGNRYIIVFNDGTMTLGVRYEEPRVMYGLPRILKMLHGMKIDEMLCLSGFTGLLVKAGEEGIFLQPPREEYHNTNYDWIVARFSNVTNILPLNPTNKGMAVEHGKNFTVIYIDSNSGGHLRMLNISGKVTESVLDSGRNKFVFHMADNSVQVFFPNGTLEETHHNIARLFPWVDTVFALTTNHQIYAIVDKSGKSGPAFPELRGIVGLYPYLSDFIAVRDDGYATMLYDRNTKLPPDIKQVFTGPSNCQNFAVVDSSGKLHLIITKSKESPWLPGPCVSTIPSKGPVTNVVVRRSRSRGDPTLSDVCFNIANDFFCTQCQVDSMKMPSPYLTNANCSKYVPSLDVFICTDTATVQPAPEDKSFPLESM